MTKRIAELLRLLADEFDSSEQEPPVSPPVEPPAPTPAPTPVPPPPTEPPVPPVQPSPPPVEPPAPPQVQVVEILKEKVNVDNLVWPTAWAWSGPYQRSTGLEEVLPGMRSSVEFQRGSLHGNTTLNEQTYTLMLNDVVVSTATVAANQKRWKFTFDAPNEPGYYKMTVGGRNQNESNIVYFLSVKGQHSGKIPVVQSSLELSERYSEEDKFHAWAMIDQSSSTRACPAKVAGSTPVKVESEQSFDMLVPGDSYPPTRLYKTSEGTLTTFSNQAYYWDQIVLRRNIDVLLKDGPRGIGTICFTTHIEVGKSTETENPNSPSRNNAYACDPWRLVRISGDGEIKTLAGARHKDDGSIEQVGDWSAVDGPKKFDILWGMCWDSRTLVVDPSLPKVEGRPVHPKNPRAYVSDSRNNRVCRVEFDGKSHDTPAKISVVLNEKGVWDCVEHNNTLIVSLRDQSRVARFTFDGEFIEDLVVNDAGDNPISIDHRHTVWRNNISLEDARKYKLLAPEGLYVVDNLLYVGSKATEDIRVFDLNDGCKLVRTVNVKMGNSHFVKFAVSDGSFGPKHTVFYGTFDVQLGGRWFGVKPDGSRWITATSQCVYPMDTYQMSFGIGKGKMLCGGSNYGILRISNGQKIDTNKYNAGSMKFFKMHGRLVYGPHGVGQNRLVTEDSDLNYFLDVNYAR